MYRQTSSLESSKSLSIYIPDIMVKSDENLLLVVETKKFGGQGDPSFQAAAAYLKFWLDKRKLNSVVKSRCPTFFIQIVENLIWISGGIILDNRCVVEPIAFLPCFSSQHQLFRFCLPVARAFACLRECLKRVAQQYKDQFSQQKQNIDIDRKFPAITWCKNFSFRFEISKKDHRKKIFFCFKTKTNKWTTINILRT